MINAGSKRVRFVVAASMALMAFTLCIGLAGAENITGVPNNLSELIKDQVRLGKAALRKAKGIEAAHSDTVGSLPQGMQNIMDEDRQRYDNAHDAAHEEVTKSIVAASSLAMLPEAARALSTFAAVHQEFIGMIDSENLKSIDGMIAAFNAGSTQAWKLEDSAIDLFHSQHGNFILFPTLDKKGGLSALRIERHDQDGLIDGMSWSGGDEIMFQLRGSLTVLNRYDAETHGREGVRNEFDGIAFLDPTKAHQHHYLGKIDHVNIVPHHTIVHNMEGKKTISHR